MTQKFYKDTNGNYLGSFDGAPPPEGSIAVEAPPRDGRQIHDGFRWLPREVSWQEKIEALDADMPRALEDIIDALDATTRARIAVDTLDKYVAKKTIRAGKP